MAGERARHGRRRLAAAPSRADAQPTRWRCSIPPGFAVIALGLLLYGWVADLPPLAGVLAAAGLLAAMARGGLTFRENLRLLRRSRDEVAHRRAQRPRPTGAA